RRPTRCASFRRSSTRRRSVVGPASDKGDPMRWMIVLLAACGSSEPSSEQQFLGTWSFASGSDSIVCPGGTTAQALSGNITVQSQSGGGLVVMDAAGCNFAYTLSGEQASLGSDKSCS